MRKMVSLPLTILRIARPGMTLPSRRHPCHPRRGSRSEPREGGPGTGAEDGFPSPHDPSDRSAGNDTPFPAPPVSPPARLAKRASGRGSRNRRLKMVSLPLTILRIARPGMTLPAPPCHPRRGSRSEPREGGPGTGVEDGFPSPHDPSDREAGNDTRPLLAQNLRFTLPLKALSVARWPNWPE